MVVLKTRDQKTITLSEGTSGSTVLTIFAPSKTVSTDNLDVGEKLASVQLTDKNRAELKKWL